MGLSTTEKGPWRERPFGGPMDRMMPEEVRARAAESGRVKSMQVGEWKWRRTLPERLAVAPHFGPDALIESIASGAVAPIRGSWLVKLWESNCDWVYGGLKDHIGHPIDGWVWHGQGGRLQRRQDLPPEAFFSRAEIQRLVTALGDDYWVLFVALSCPWLAEAEADPHGHHLRIVGDVAQRYLGMKSVNVDQPHWMSPLVKAFVNAGEPAEAADFALFWDYGSLYQRPRTRLQEESYLQGVQSSSVWYGHKETVCWLQTDLPPRFAQQAEAAGRATSFQHNGWCFVEAAISGIVKVGHRRLDLSKRNERSMCICYSGYGNLSLDSVCVAQRLPPHDPADMLQLLREEKRFADPADVDLAAAVYQSCFEQISMIVPKLDFASLGWGPLQGRQLAGVLHRFTDLITLDMRHNAVEGDGAERLAAAVISHPTLEVFAPIPLRELRGGGVNTLNLQGKDMGSIGGLVLGGLFQSIGCGSLLSLKLGDCKLRDVGASAIAKSLVAAGEMKKCTLASLEIGGNGIGEKGAKAIANLCQKNRTLTTLAIDPGIGREGQARLALIMKDRRLIFT